MAAGMGFMGFALSALFVIVASGLKRKEPHSSEEMELRQGMPSPMNLNDTELSVQMDLDEGKALQATLEKYAATLPEGATKDLLRSFRVCGACQNFQRFGEPNDGGYLMCMDHMYGVTAAYSMGVEHHDKWSGDVAATWHVPVYQMDCTVKEAAQVCPGCHFFRSCLSAPGGPKPAWTLAETLQHTGQGAAGDRTLFGKIDIEGSEWGALAAADVSVLRRFRQLVIEFHRLNEGFHHASYLKAMKKLEMAGLRVVHIHGNNNGPMYSAGEYQIPVVIEATFDSSAQPLAECLPDQKMRALDSPNNAVGTELPPAHLPNF